MKRYLLAAVMMAGLAGAPAMADQFTPAQRAEIVAIVRDALKTDPSILRDAVASMQAEEDAKTAAASKLAIQKHQAEIVASDPGAVSGNPNGKVTVVMFYDTRCPYCRRMTPDIQALLAADHDVRWVYKDFPILGDNSTIEAKALLAAERQGGYAKLQALFLKQGGTETEANIGKLAESVGLDGARLLADMKDPKVLAAINANLALGSALNITGTPAFVIGDTLVPGAVDLDDLKKLVGAPG